jgi:hypothetical protein
VELFDGKVPSNPNGADSREMVGPAIQSAFNKAYEVKRIPVIERYRQIVPSEPKRPA